MSITRPQTLEEHRVELRPQNLCYAEGLKGTSLLTLLKGLLVFPDEVRGKSTCPQLLPELLRQVFVEDSGEHVRNDQEVCPFPCHVVCVGSGFSKRPVRRGNSQRAVSTERAKLE